MRVIVVLLAAGTGMAAQAEEPCVVRDSKRYYGVDLDESFDTRRYADPIAEALYRGPLMREPDPAGLVNLSGLLRKEEIQLHEIERIVRSHLYGASEEFQKLLEVRSEETSAEEAAQAIAESVYRAFGGSEVKRPDPDLDTCLIRRGLAHYVVTKALVHYLENQGLDRGRSGARGRHGRATTRRTRRSAADLARFCGSPLGESVAPNGRFVMSTGEELQPAFEDGRNGAFLD